MSGWTGTDTQHIYIGVDKTWYSGSTWTRPKLNGDNPLNVSPVSSCPYGVGTNNNFVNLVGSFVTFDNFEFLGICSQGANIPYGNDSYLIVYGSHDSIFSNLYMHGWTHRTFDADNNASVTGIVGDTHQDAGKNNQFVGLLIDGADSDPTSGGGIFGECYDVHNSIFRYNSNAVICNNMHTFHDNLFEYIYNSTSPGTHSNVFEFNGEFTGSNYVFKNIVRHVYTPVTVWVNPNATDYYFNNVIYDALQQVWDSGTMDFSPVIGQFFMYNNTFADVNKNYPSPVELYYPRSYLINNHFINDVRISSSVPADHQSNNLIQTETQANAQGYNAANGYAPTNPSGSTVDAGTSAPANIFTTDIFGVRRPQGSAWDIGAYEYVQGGDTTPPAAPTNLTVN